MPSSTETPAATPTPTPAETPSPTQAATPARWPGGGRGEVREISFDRPLSGGGTGAAGLGWGDPRLDAALAQAVATARAEGMAQGYAAGWTAGRQAAAEQAGAEAAQRARTAEADRRDFVVRTESLVTALTDAARAAGRAAEPTWDDLAGVITDGTLALARAALARELTTVDADLELRMRTALRLVAGDGRVVVHLNPADVAVLAGARLPGGTELFADAAVAPGAVAVRTDAQRLLLDVPAAVAAAEEVLRS